MIKKIIPIMFLIGCSPLELEEYGESIEVIREKTDSALVALDDFSKEVDTVQIIEIIREAPVMMRSSPAPVYKEKEVDTVWMVDTLVVKDTVEVYVDEEDLSRY